MLWVQSAYLNSELALNNQRSENEMRSMSILAQEILSTNPEKPVIFIGKHNSGEYFKHAKKEYSDTMAGVFYQKVIDAFKDRYGDYYYTFFLPCPPHMFGKRLALCSFVFPYIGVEIILSVC